MNIGQLVYWETPTNQLRWGTIEHLEERPGVKLCAGDSEAGEVLYLDADQLNTELSDGVYPDIPDSVYHQLPSLSASGAKLLLPPSVPAKYRERMDNPPEHKQVFDFGKLVHTLVLGKGAAFAIVDAPDWRGKYARVSRDEAYKNGQTPVLEQDYVVAEKICHEVRCHPTAGDLLTNGQAETSLFATDAATGTRLRARPDWMTVRDGRLWIIDLKTSVTAEPKGFARRAADYFYHLQAAFYCYVARLLGLDDDPAFILVAVEKEPPYLVSVVEFDAEAMTEGARLARKAIDTYTRCVETGEWPGYPEDIVPINLPAWAFQATDGPTIGELLEIGESA